MTNDEPPEPIAQSRQTEEVRLFKSAPIARRSSPAITSPNSTIQKSRCGAVDLAIRHWVFFRRFSLTRVLSNLG